MLRGLKVLELAQMVAAPFCGKLLAELGADVVKVEPSPDGDAARSRGPFVKDGDPDGSALFLYLNTNKRGITLNLETDAGRGIFKRLAGQVDVVVSDLEPARASAWGLDDRALRELHERLIVVSVTPFGSTGPHRGFRAHDLNVFHGGGEGYVLGAGLSHELFPERPPVTASEYLADYQTGLTGAVGALAAVLARGLSGRGQHVDVSGQDAQLSLNHLVAMRFIDGTLERRANRSFTYGGVIPCKDGYVEILPLEQHMWTALGRLIGDPDWAGSKRFATGRERAKFGEEINARIREWAADKTREEIYLAGQQLGCPVGPYYDPAEVARNDQLRARGFFIPIEHPTIGAGEYPVLPFRFAADETRGRPAPRLGEHNGEVFGTWLGLDDAEVASLRQGGATSTPVVRENHRANL